MADQHVLDRMALLAGHAVRLGNVRVPLGGAEPPGTAEG